MKYSSVVMERIYASLTQGFFLGGKGGGVLYEKVPLSYTFYWQKEGSNPRRKGKNVVFPAQAEYSYLSANLRLKIF